MLPYSNRMLVPAPKMRSGGNEPSSGRDKLAGGLDKAGIGGVCYDLFSEAGEIEPPRCTPDTGPSGGGDRRRFDFLGLLFHSPSFYALPARLNPAAPVPRLS